MSSYSGYVATGFDDYDYDGSYRKTGDTIDCTRIRDGGGSLTLNREAFVELDTSDVEESWVISDAELHWYTNSCTKTPKEDPWGTAIYMWGGASYEIIDSSVADRADGWDSVTLTGGEIAYINRSGETNFKFTVSNSATSNSTRQWVIRASEYMGNFDIMLVLTYTIPASSRRQRIIIIS